MFYQAQHFGLPEHFRKEYGKNFSFPAHLHQSFEVIILLSGEMEVIADSQKYTLLPGEAILIFPNQVHSLEGTDSEHMLCIFSPELVKAFWSKVSKYKPTQHKFRMDPYLRNALCDLGEGSSLLQKKGVLYSVCAAFDDGMRYEEKGYRDEKLLHQIFSFVEANFGGDCSLHDLAHTLGFSYSYLSRYFKKNVGLSFNEYVNRYRINNACYVLQNTDHSVLQCALDSGYKSLRSFNRNFVSYLSVTPKEYRENFH